MEMSEIRLYFRRPKHGRVETAFPNTFRREKLLLQHLQVPWKNQTATKAVSIRETSTLGQDSNPVLNKS